LRVADARRFVEEIVGVQQLRAMASANRQLQRAKTTAEWEERKD
jgi:hypothetical protein